MRITIEIDERVVEAAMKLTGEKKKGPAISKATAEFVQRQEVRNFATRVMEGGFPDYPLTNDQIEAIDRR